MQIDKSQLCLAVLPSPFFPGTVKSLIFASEKLFKTETAKLRNISTIQCSKRKVVADRSPVLFKPRLNVSPGVREGEMAVALLDCVCCTIKCAFWVKFCMQEEIHFEPDWGFRSHLVRKKCTPKRERATGTAERNAAGKSCRTQAYTAYPGILSACLLNESTALQFLMHPTT